MACYEIMKNLHKITAVKTEENFLLILWLSCANTERDNCVDFAS